MPPESIAGRYDVVREVGRGGMGAVWLCTDRTLGREVAVKRVGGLPGESTPHLARALREARSAAALNHPNVVSIYDAIEDGGHVWLVMEYLPSRNLSELLKEGPLDPRRAAHLGAQVADGLAAAHERGTIHRDVKPGNILVTDDDVAKISDFGIARTLGDEQLTQTGLVTGTPLYFSPALARGQLATPADDVWALGATLFAAVDGEPPWPSQDNSIAMLMHIANHEPPVPRRAGPLTEPIRRMMDVDPAARPSMAQVAATLRAIAAGTSDLTATALMPAPVAGAGAVAGASAAAAAPVAGRAEWAEPVETPASPGPDRRRRGGAMALVVAVAVLVLALGGALLAGLLGDDDESGTATDEPTSERSPGQQRTRQQSPSQSETTEPSPEPSPEPTTQAPETETQEPETTPTPDVSRGNEQQLVRDYYGLLPGDIDAGWSLIAPALQQQVGYGSYRGFWSTIDSVEVRGVRPQGGGTVLVDLVYNGSDRETREITVRDGLLVADGVVTQ